MVLHLTGNMNYKEIIKNNPDLKEIPVKEIEVTFTEDYFAGGDFVKFNSDNYIVSKVYKDKNGDYKIKLKSIYEKPSVILTGHKINYELCEE